MQIIEGPNKKAVTVLLSESELQKRQELLGFERFSIDKEHALSDVSPFAKAAKTAMGDFSRLDYNKTSEGGIISVIRALPWSSKGRDTAFKQISEWGDKFVEPGFLTSRFNALPPLNKERALVELVDSILKIEEIELALAKDGGQILLKDVPLNSNGNFSAEMILMGSCAGCSQATERTLHNIEELIILRLQAWKRSDPDNKPIQNLTFVGIESVTFDKTFYIQAEPVKAEKRSGFFSRILGR